VSALNEGAVASFTVSVEVEVSSELADCLQQTKAVEMAKIDRQQVYFSKFIIKFV